MTDSTHNQSPIASKDVFVTYAWDKENPDHQKYVAAFVNRLRTDGINAEVDLLKSQEETAINFQKMMHKAIADYSKVIIFLSPKYREKADLFKDGVGTEYELIISDIAVNSRKYILVSTYGHSPDVMPVAFRNRDVVSLSNPIKIQELDQIKSKIWDINLQPFVEVAAERKLPVVNQPPVLDVDEGTTPEAVSINQLWAEAMGASQSYSKFTNIEYHLSVDMVNNSTATLTDIILEITLPIEFTGVRREPAMSRYRQDNRYYYIGYTFAKTYPNQTQFSSSIVVTVDHDRVKALYGKAIKATVYGEGIFVEKEFPIESMLYFAGNGPRRMLTPDDFGPMQF